MSNEKFREYSTSTAFMLMLSKNQCHALLRVDRAKGTDHYSFHTGTSRGLEDRGLIESLPIAERGITTPDCMGLLWRLTNAGDIVVDLLVEAGMTVENTMTPHASRSDAFWGPRNEFIKKHKEAA